MNENEFFEILHNDDFYKYLSELRKTFKKELERGTDGSNKTYNYSCYNTIIAISDNYLYYLEKKYNVGRGKHE